MRNTIKEPLSSFLDYSQHVATGFPSPAMDYLQPGIDLISLSNPTVEYYLYYKVISTCHLL